MTTTKKPCNLSCASGSRSLAGISSRGSLEGIPGSRSPKGIPGSRTLGGISDNELLGRIRKLSDTERETVLSILVHLIEIDRRRLYLPRGYSSLFEFCVKHLGYSESTAGRRIAIARCIRDFPRVFDLLAECRTNLSNVSKITGIITPGNAERLLAGIEGRSNREVDLIVSRHRPRNTIRDRVKPVYVMTEIQVPVDTANAGTSGEAAGLFGDKTKVGEKSTPIDGSGKSPNSGGGSDSAAGGKAGPDSGKGAVTERRMILEQRFKVEFGVDPGFLEKLERVRSLLSTKHRAKLEFEELFELLMDEYIDRHSPEGRIRKRTERRKGKSATKHSAEREKRKTGQIVPKTSQKQPKSSRKQMKTERKQTQPSQAEKPQRKHSQGQAQHQNQADHTQMPLKRRHKPSGPQQKQELSRHIPRSVRDEVYARDRGRCTFVAPGGKRCGSTWDLQIDHIVPFARGGDNSPGNLRLLCAKHNRLEAKRAFGEKHMEQFCDP